MASLPDALTAITAGIAGLLDPKVDVASHPGRFTEAELERLILKARAVPVGIEQVTDLQTQGPGGIRAQLVVSAYIVCGDSPAAPRHLAALGLVDSLLAGIPYQRWGTPWLTAALPASLRADNLYSGEINAKGLALWALSWQQGIQTP